MKLKEGTAEQEEKNKLSQEIKSAEETVKAMKMAMKSMDRFIQFFPGLAKK